MRKLLLMQLEPLVMLSLKRICGQEMDFPPSVHVDATRILDGGALALKVCDICLICPEKTWSEFIY